MQYKCEKCLREFAFEDQIEYCPYCGNNLVGISPIKATSESYNGLEKTIDSIWGESAKLKQEFSKVISSCIQSINGFIEFCVGKILPKEDISHYEQFYSAVKQSNNRKALLDRIDHFITDLGETINRLSYIRAEDASNTLHETASRANDLKSMLYGFLEMHYTPSVVDFRSKENCAVEVFYTKEQLKVLYELVQGAFSKYKRCVEDNNMFAAFASTSDYGMISDYWRGLFSNYANNREDEEKEEEDIDYKRVVEYMKTQNLQQYQGMLDEDFVPHVDAFWYGLEKLCSFIDAHLEVDYNTESIYINASESSKILRVIMTKNFPVDEMRLENAVHFEKTLSDRIDKLEAG